MIQMRRSQRKNKEEAINERLCGGKVTSQRQGNKFMDGGETMKLRNGLLAVLFLIGVGASSCATMRGPMTEEEEEEMVKIQNERWPQEWLNEAGGDN
jgi:hypothetical protein